MEYLGVSIDPGSNKLGVALWYYGQGRAQLDDAFTIKKPKTGHILDQLNDVLIDYPEVELVMVEDYAFGVVPYQLAELVGAIHYMFSPKIATVVKVPISTWKQHLTGYGGCSISAYRLAVNSLGIFRNLSKKEEDTAAAIGIGKCHLERIIKVVIQ